MKFTHSQKTLLQTVIIFTLTLGTCLTLQLATPNVLGNDVFFHLEMAELIKESGFQPYFPWLTETIFADGWVNHHLLFHLALIPFLFILPTITAGKVAAAVFAALAATAIFLFTRTQKIKYALFWTIILLTVSHAFLFRLNLIRAQSLSLTLLFLGLLFARRKNYISLVVVSFLYAWLFNGFIILGGALLIYFVYDLVKTIQVRKFRRRVFLPPLLYAFGVVSGLFLHPHYPRNFQFLRLHLFNIGLGNQGSDIPVGVEWSHYALKSFLENEFIIYPALLSLVLLLLLLIFQIVKPQTINSRRVPNFLPNFIVFGLLSAAFTYLTLQSVRFIEYLIPFTAVFTAVNFSFLVQKFNPARKLRKFFRRNLPLQLLTFPSLILVILVIAALNFLQTYQDFLNGSPPDKYEAASQYLIENSLAGSIVFQSDWDQFPPLFFHNTHNYYLVGLDPKYMYERNPQRYWLWANLTTQGIICETAACPEDSPKPTPEEVADLIKNQFQAEYVFYGWNDHPEFKALIEENSYLVLVFDQSDLPEEKPQTQVYQVQR